MPKKQQTDDDEYYTIKSDPGIVTIVSDLPQTMTMINNYSMRLKELRTALVPTMTSISTTAPTNEKSEFYVNNGISFLQLRTQILLQYNMNLLQYMTLRTDGRKIKNHPCITRLVHLRLLLERIKPIMTQLQYQVDQILQQGVKSTISSSSSNNTEQDTSTTTTTTKHSTTTKSQDEQFTAEIPLTKEQRNELKKKEYRERQEAMKEHLAEQEKEFKTLNKNLQFSSPQDISDFVNLSNVGDDAASQWHEKERQIARAEAQQEKVRDKALYSTLVKQIREELSERPVEQSASGLSMHKLRTREQRERVEFEEDNYTRLQENRNERKKQRRLDRLQGMDDIEEVADYRALYEFDSKQKQQRQREDAMREYEAAQEQVKLMDKIEQNVRRKHGTLNNSSRGANNRKGGF